MLRRAVLWCAVLCSALPCCAVQYRSVCSAVFSGPSVRWHAMLGCIDLGYVFFSIGRSFCVLHARRSLTAPTTTMTAVELPGISFFVICDISSVVSRFSRLFPPELKGRWKPTGVASIIWEDYKQNKFRQGVESFHITAIFIIFLHCHSFFNISFFIIF